jgi:hypothetical protein
MLEENTMKKKKFRRIQILSLRYFLKIILQDLTVFSSRMRDIETARLKMKKNTSKFCKHKKYNNFRPFFNVKLHGIYRLIASM